MPRQKSADQLQALRQQQIELAKRIKETEAREREKAKADSERRKLLLGSLVLDDMAATPDSPLAAAVRDLLARGLRRAADKALFANLTPLPSPPKNE